MGTEKPLLSDLDSEPIASWQRKVIREIKTGSYDRRIRILNFEGKQVGYSRPIIHDDLENDKLIETFVRWRNQNLSGWLDQRPVTFDGTKRWLAATLNDDTRYNSLIFCNDRLIGRAGMVDLRRYCCTSDGIVRGERGGGINFMKYFNIASMAWDFEHLDLKVLYSKVLISNDLAIRSIFSLGYEIEKEIDLYKDPENPELLQEEQKSERLLKFPEKLCYAKLTRERFEKMRKQIQTEVIR